MFAIQMTHENLPTILESFSTPAEDEFNYTLFMNQNSMFYVVTGFVNLRGAFIGFAVQPARILENKFDIADTEKIKADWTTIVRK